MNLSPAQMLSNARKHSRLTQQQVAERAGTSQSAVNRYEKGITSPSIDTMQRLLRANGLELVLDFKKARKIHPRSELAKKVQANRGEIKAILNSVGAKNIRIFGSVSRGDDDENSDLDILVSQHPRENYVKIYSKKNELSKLLGVDVDIAIEEMLKGEQKRSILRDAIPL